MYANFQVTQSAKRLTTKVTQVDVVRPNHVNLNNLSCEPLSRLSNLEVDIYDPTLKSIWSRYH